ncbi:MAG: Asp-tRNA(Asn)/Glu-tRNA(Gln) amidotransferase subunit GatC [bacterium]|nr:Asp-tRNA(Asn)/Glu-tRNA(Gln) amidotransferase subunit GatC [bacterium]
MTISPEDVSKIARLSRLKFNDMESEKLRQGLSSILDWVEQLNEVNVDGVEPLNSVFVDALPKREDVVTDGNQPKALTSNAPESDHDMFCVPKVVE